MNPWLNLDDRQGRSSTTALANSTTALASPLVVNSYIGVLSGFEILALALFALFLAWTFYIRISNDFTKMTPIKTFELKRSILLMFFWISYYRRPQLGIYNMCTYFYLYFRWQLKLFRIATRSGLLAEACLALLLLPVLRGMTIFRLLGIQFEASIRYHIWLGTSMIFFATLHSIGTLFIWGVKQHIRNEVSIVLFHYLNYWAQECKLQQYLPIESTDVEVAEDRPNIPCRRDCFCYRARNLDHITSTSEKTTIWNILLHAPSIHSILGILPVSYWRSSLLYGFPWCISLWPRQVTPSNTIKAKDMRSVCSSLPKQISRAYSSKKPEYVELLLTES